MGMSQYINDLIDAFSYAAGADPLYVLLPLAFVALVQGLLTDNALEASARAMTGLFWFAVTVFVFGGMMRDDRFEIDAWTTRLDAAWETLLDIRLLEALGFYLLMLAGILLVSTVRGVVRR